MFFCVYQRYLRELENLVGVIIHVVCRIVLF